MAADPTTLELEYRLMYAAQDWLGTPFTGGADPTGRLEAARQVIVANIVQRRRDQDGVITPNSDTAKLPRLLLTASDRGRVKPYLPQLRILRLEFEVRANHLLPQGMEAEWAALLGAVETLLYGANLLTGLTSPLTRGICIMLATVRDAAGLQVKGGQDPIRSKTYPVDIRAIGAEHTVEHAPS